MVRGLISWLVFMMLVWSATKIWQVRHHAGNLILRVGVISQLVREIRIPQSLCPTLGKEGCQILNQLLIPRGEGNCGSYRRKEEIRHVI